MADSVAMLQHRQTLNHNGLGPNATEEDEVKVVVLNPRLLRRQRGRSSLVHGAFDAVGHEVDSRVGSRPSGGDVVGKYECWSPSVISVPALGDVESASTG